MKNKKTILITGAASGFGKDSAIALAKRGHKVIATTRTNESAQKLTRETNGLDIKTFKLDITKKEDRQKILELDLDVLINNAGTGQSGSLAEIDINRVKEDFETNVFSSITLTQLALKKMMAKNKGTIIFISSLAGRTTMPFLGSYCMSKFALSAGAETMRNELHRISDVHVCLVEPGAYHTGFNQKNINKKYTWMNQDSYFYKMLNKIKKDEQKYFNFMELRSSKSIVDKIVKAAEAKKPKLRYVAPWWQGLGVQVMRIFGK